MIIVGFIIGMMAGVHFCDEIKESYTKVRSKFK